MYVERYWKIDDARRGDRQSAPFQDTELNLERYWRLCEDELDVTRLGWVSGRTWCLWHRRIRDETRHHADDVDAKDFRRLTMCVSQAEHRPWDCPGLGPLG